MCKGTVLDKLDHNWYSVRLNVQVTVLPDTNPTLGAPAECPSATFRLQKLGAYTKASLQSSNQTGVVHLIYPGTCVHHPLCTSSTSNAALPVDAHTVLLRVATGTSDSRRKMCSRVSGGSMTHPNGA